MKKAFTLVELLVVIGILGVLMAVMVVAMSGGSQSALNIKCETNLRNLAAACQTYGMAHGHYPLAGSVEKMSIDSSGGVNDIKTRYDELPGWISWNSKGAYPEKKKEKPTTHRASSGWFTSAYNEEPDVRIYSLTNGALWKYVSGNTEVYRCPVHVNKFRKNPPVWSYVMNSYFGWDNSEGQYAKDSVYSGRGYGNLKRADRRLLFAEIPFMGIETDGEVDTSTGAGTINDCTLQYQEKDGGEAIGFNHSSGKREKFALVVFADAHTERISWPKDGLNEANLKDLTRWLCEGKDVSFNGTRYEVLTKDQ